MKTREAGEGVLLATAAHARLPGGAHRVIWLIPLLEDAFSWRWAFAFLAPGPLLGVVAMLRLKSLPEAARIAGGRG